MRRDTRLLAPFLVRQVRAGVIATALIVVSLAVAYFGLEHSSFDRLTLATVLGLAAVGVVFISLLPWPSLFEGQRGMWVLYGWSAADIVLIGWAIAATGGGRSDLFMLYTLTTLFFSASYPGSAQILLLAFTATSYTTVLLLSGWEISAGSYTARLSMLAVVAYLAGYLSDELFGRAHAEAEARNEASRRATLMSHVAAAGRDMSLDPTQVVEVAVSTVVRLGFEDAAFVALREDGTASHVVDGAQRSRLSERRAERVAELVAREGATTIGDLDADPSAWPTGGGSTGLVASPVWVGGWLAAALIGSKGGQELPADHEVEAFELLATQAGFALDNAGRYTEQRRTVERLEEADRLKTDFMTTVSHELRTPLTSILGNAATLEGGWDGLDRATRRDLLRRLTANARALETKITDLLDFADSSRPLRSDEPFGPVDLSRVLEEAGRAMAGELADHAFEIDVPAGLATLGDGALLTRVVGNLLRNAATHTPPGTAVLLSARLEGDVIIVSVSDDGPGIAGSDLPYLGDRFYRAGNINVRPSGLGLGLALANEILELHDTSLEVQSSVGRGSTFRFDLPALTGEDLRHVPRDQARGT